MGKVREYLEHLSKTNEQTQTNELLRIVNKHKSQLIDANQLQLFAGRNADGGILGEYSNRDYALFKNRLNPTPGLGIWDLKLTGRLYDGMYIEADSFPVKIDSSDPKASKFRDANPFGFDTKSKEDFREEIKPDIQEYYRSVFKLQ